MEESLCHNDVSFDDDTLTKLRGVCLYINATKGAPLQDVQVKIGPGREQPGPGPVVAESEWAGPEGNRPGREIL